MYTRQLSPRVYWIPISIVQQQTLTNLLGRVNTSIISCSLNIVSTTCCSLLCTTMQSNDTVYKPVFVYMYVHVNVGTVTPENIPGPYRMFKGQLILRNKEYIKAYLFPFERFR